VEGGQATRIVEAYRVQERSKLPDEPYVELARIDIDPADAAIRNAKKASRPGTNEINLNSRQDARATVTESAPPPVAPPPAEQPPAEAPPSPMKAATAETARETVVIGHVVLGGASDDLHRAGLENLARSAGRQNGFNVEVRANAPLDKSILECAMVYLTGNSGFELDKDQQAHLQSLLESGRVIIGEGCSDGQEETKSNGAREFGLAFNQLATQLGRKLEVVQRGHALLSAAHVFSAAPDGADGSSMLMEQGHTVYSGCDYGCAWQGGHQANPLPRDSIRSAFEMGANMVGYARLARANGKR
jgi:hypothetical protein